MLSKLEPEQIMRKVPQFDQQAYSIRSSGKVYQLEMENQH